MYQGTRSMPWPALVVTLAISAGLVAFAATALAPLHSPTLASKFQCPRGSRVQVSEYHASYHEPGETGISFTCVDAQGTAREAAGLETKGFWVLFGIFFVPVFATFLVLGWLIARLRRRQAARWSWPGGLGSG